MVEKTVADFSKNNLKEKKPTGCGLIFWFFILVLLGMLLVLFIKVMFFSNPTQT
jgi:cytoskeletal protein RodZ